jgi:hypothetical protein
VGTALWTLPKPGLDLLRCTLLIVGGVAVEAIAPDTMLHAQGVTTVAIRGTVRIDGGDAEGARVVVRNTATGFMVDIEVRQGRFLVQGLEAGGPYSITVRQIGTLARQWNGVFLTLGEPLELDVTLDPAPFPLDSVVVVADPLVPLSCCHGGTATTLSDSLVHRLPSLNREVYDFLRLVPQLSTRLGFGSGISGGGVGFRFNSFLTNGVPERSLGGNQPLEFAGGRSLPFDAVGEYQVLLAPFDVRYGDFAGAMVNTVTRSGANRFQATGFAYGRSDALGQGGDLAGDPYELWQYGVSFSGPIVHDRVQFLVASDFRRLNSPMVGPFVGQPEGVTPPVPVRGTDLARLESILRQYDLEAGSGGLVPNQDRGRSLFARVDAALPKWNSRAVLWVNDSDSRGLGFSRADAPDVFALSSLATEVSLAARTVALQLYTTLRRRGGGHNELSLSRRTNALEPIPEVRQPFILVTLPATPSGLTTVLTGTPPDVQGGGITSWELNLRDDLTLPFGESHVANFGFEAKRFRLRAGGLDNAFGTWSFASLDSLEAGQAESFELARDFGSADVPLSGSQFAAYAGDNWQVGERVSLTLGLRADMLALSGRAPYNSTVDSLFGRRTDDRLRRTIHLSPRIGFTWDPRGSGRDQIRGGLGVFTGRPPLAWFHVPLQNYGVGIGTLSCGSFPNELDPPPAFEPDPLHPPIACANGVSEDTPPPGDVELVDPDLRMAQTLRGVLAYDRRLPGGVIGTVEGLVTRNLSDFVFVNRNLAGPQGTDGRGRVLYGSIDDLGQASPVLVTESVGSVMELRNVSGNHSVQLSASLAKHFEGGFAAMASYTWSRVRDVQTPLRINIAGIENWSSRAVSGRHEDLSAGVSLNDVPHRLVLAGTWRAPWRRWLTEVSLMYVGESGSPFTFVAGGEGGDLNADGANNDPIYVPRSALNPDEIVFTGLEPDGDNSPDAQQARVGSQREAFERFIGGTSCLSRQRGRIMERNSCREPWAHTTAASLRQMIPIGSQTLEAQLDVFNLLNLLDRDWGLRRFANPVLVEHVGQRPAGPGQSEPVFRFVESDTDLFTDPGESAFQLQFGLRYRF